MQIAQKVVKNMQKSQTFFQNPLETEEVLVYNI